MNPHELVNDPAARVRQLVDTASAFEVDNNTPPKRYCRSGMEMVRMADIYSNEGNVEAAFKLYTKFITLVLEKLRDHPLYKTLTPLERESLKKKVGEVFPKAETTKQALLRRYTIEKEEWAVKMKVIMEERAREEARRKEELERKRVEQEQTRQFQDEKEWRLQQQLELLSFQDKKHSDNDFSNGGLSSIAWPDEMANSHTSKVIPSPLPRLSVPSVDRTTKPGSAVVETVDSLRVVEVPSDISQKFLALAYNNTVLNIETCGILAGKLALNRFTITHLLIPKQSGTPDSCTTENEEDLFLVQDKYGLITLGWIHTHPSQTAFMSSVDLHTQYSYQMMMPEAIAMVCAPQFNETGVYSLTQNHGLGYLSKCNQSGFHPHPDDPPLYEASPHVKFNKSTSVTVIDLRH